MGSLRIFSSPKPKVPGELLVWEASVRRLSTLSNDFTSETTGPNVTNFICSIQALGERKIAKMVLIRN